MAFDKKRKNDENKADRDFPGGPVVKNPPSNARYAGSTPGPGTKIPHVVGQLRPCCNYIACASQLERGQHTATKIPRD